jgi:hypothetical protein
LFLGDEEDKGAEHVRLRHRSAGGNACESSYFVLSFPRGEAPRIDGPLDSCLPSSYRVGNDSILVDVKPTSTAEGRRWTWAPQGGFSPPEIIAFVPSRADGWNAMRSRTIDHPTRLLSYADSASLVTERVPARLRDAIQRIAAGPGIVQYRDGVAVAFACQAHSCDDTTLLIAADIPSRRVFVAIKDSSGPPSINPSFAQWPPAAGAEVAKFREKFVH